MQADLGTDEAVASIDAKSLMLLGRLLGDAGLTGQGKEHQAFAVALARLAGQDKILADKPWRYWYYAAPLGTPETRQTLQAELADKQGNPRLEVAGILVRAYYSAEKIRAWQAFLDEKIAASAAGDAKALWLIARAQGEAFLTYEPYPLYGRKWLEQAFNTAGSAPCRLAALRELALAYADVGRGEKALALIDGAAGRFGAEAAADLEALRQEIRQTKATQEPKGVVMGKRAEYMEAQAQKAAEKGDDSLKNYFLKWAGRYHERERKLLKRDGL